MSKHGSSDGRKSLRIAGQAFNGGPVELGGHDVSSALTGLTLRLEAGRAPTAVLDVVVWDLSAELESARVEIPDETRALLVQLGWTPPSDGEQQGGGG